MSFPVRGASLTSRYILLASLCIFKKDVAATPSIKVLTPKDSAHLQNLANKIETQDELEQFCQLPESTSSSTGRQVGVAPISQVLASGLKEASGVNPFAPDAKFSAMQHSSQATIRSFCSVLTETSPLHSDTVHHLPDVSDDPHYFHPRLAKEHDKAAFVFLESNPDAYFSWGGHSFPVEKGNMLVFDGSTPHQTVIGNGIVKLLGPFDVETFRLVGPGTTSTLPTIPGLPPLPTITLPTLPTLPTFDLDLTLTGLVFSLLGLIALVLFGVLVAVD